MLNRATTTAFLLLLMSLASRTPAWEPPLKERPNVKSALALFDAWVESQRAYQGIPGLAIAIVHDQEVLFSKAYGVADASTDRAMTLDSRFRLASHSKSFVAIAIMQLCDAGKLGLDDPLASHLDWLAADPKRSDAASVTIRQLLTHSSGLEREGSTIPYWENGQFPPIESIKDAGALESLFAKATTWKYSNLNYVLLGEVVATRSGMPLETYIRDNVLRPLDMSDSSMIVDDIPESELAVGYGRRLPDGSRETFPIYEVRGLQAAAGLTSSTHDMIKYVKWQLRLQNDESATEIIKASTLRKMQQEHWPLPDDWKGGWGLGFHLAEEDDATLIGHPGGLQGFKTATYIDPSSKMGVIVYANSLDAQVYPGEPASMLDRAFKWIGKAVLETQPAASPPKEFNTAIKQFWGTYRSIWGDIFVYEKDGELIFVDINSPDPMAMPSVLERIDGRSGEFHVKTGNPFFYLGEKAVFSTVNSDQPASSVLVGPFEFQRVRQE